MSVQCSGGVPEPLEPRPARLQAIRARQWSDRCAGPLSLAEPSITPTTRTCSINNLRQQTLALLNIYRPQTPEHAVSEWRCVSTSQPPWARLSMHATIQDTAIPCFNYFIDVRGAISYVQFTICLEEKQLDFSLVTCTSQRLTTHQHDINVLETFNITTLSFE